MADFPINNIVLVHGGFVDGSGWEGVHHILTGKGFNVTVVQNPTTSLADDVAVTRRAIAAQDGPVLLVGHSYGGVVITEAGNDPKVGALAYIAAFAPDAGESVSSLIAEPPPGAPVPPILPPQDGLLFLDREKFAASFAADVSPGQAASLMAERAGAEVIETGGSHAIYVSKPQAVAELLERAAAGRWSERIRQRNCSIGTDSTEVERDQLSFGGAVLRHACGIASTGAATGARPRPGRATTWTPMPPMSSRWPKRST